MPCTTWSTSGSRLHQRAVIAKAQILSKPVNNDDLFIHSAAHHTSEKYRRTSPIVGSSNATRFSLTARVFPCLVCQAEAQRALKQPTPGTLP